MAINFDLTKSADALRLNLEKKGIVIPAIDVVFALDVSGSFDDEHRNGVTNDLMKRFVPWAMVFDPDKKFEVYTFSDGASNAQHVGDVTKDNVDGYVEENIIDTVRGYNGGTDYSYVLEKMLEDFGWKEGEKPGIFGRFFGGKPSHVEKRRSIVIFVTDGSNSDQTRTERVLAESAARGDVIYFLFLGVSNQPSTFNFIHRMGDKFDNVGFAAIKDIKGFVKASDDQINEMLVTDELIAFLKRK